MKEVILKVNGMVCNGCENRVKNALESVEEISDVQANHQKGIVTIHLKKEVEQNKIEEKIENLGFTVMKD